jgi:hypothetical protein
VDLEALLNRTLMEHERDMLNGLLAIRQEAALAAFHRMADAFHGLGRSMAELAEKISAYHPAPMPRPPRQRRPWSIYTAAPRVRAVPKVLGPQKGSPLSRARVHRRRT